MEKRIQCECGETVRPCAMHIHLQGGYHAAAMTRKNALQGKEGYDIHLCSERRHVYEKCGFPIVENAFWHGGGKSMPGRFKDGFIHPKEGWKEKIQQAIQEISEEKRLKKIEQMRRYRKENREELLQKKREKYPYYRAQRQAKKAIEAMGKEGDDDRIRLTHPLLIAKAENGLIIRSREKDIDGLPRIVQVVVKDSTTGLVHFLTIPPEFGKKKVEDTNKAYQLVHAAIAWTFGLEPQDYAPAIEA